MIYCLMIWSITGIKTFLFLKVSPLSVLPWFSHTISLVTYRYICKYFEQFCGILNVHIIILALYFFNPFILAKGFTLSKTCYKLTKLYSWQRYRYMLYREYGIVLFDWFRLTQQREIAFVNVEVGKWLLLLCKWLKSPIHVHINWIGSIFI